MTIEILNKISRKIEDQMRLDWTMYDNANEIDLNHKQFFMVMKNEAGEVVGILKAYTVFAEIYVDELWVDSKHRNFGYGKKLLNELYEEFKGKGYWNINLCTSEYQAPKFYKKCGFELEFVRKNSQNKKLTKYFFVKYYNEPQTQGNL